MHAFDPSRGRWISGFEDSLVDRASYRTVRTITQRTLSQMKKKKEKVLTPQNLR